MVGVVGDRVWGARAVEVKGSAVTHGQELTGVVTEAARRQQRIREDNVELRGELLEQRPRLRRRRDSKRDMGGSIRRRGQRIERGDELGDEFQLRIGKGRGVRRWRDAGQQGQQRIALRHHENAQVDIRPIPPLWESEETKLEGRAEDGHGVELC
jgi:hypothetical protein